MGYGAQLWSPQTIDLISRLERVQRPASKYILDLPFICETSYKQRLIDLQSFQNLKSLELQDHWMRTLKSSKTSTYQQTYTIRTTRIWNILPRPITNKFNSLTIFKKLLLQYYHTALELNYNVDDLRSWKTICLKCNQARDLTKPITCCF